MRFCPVPALVGSALLNRPWRTHDWSLRPTFSASRLAMIGALWVGTRQFVHERSGLPPPSLASPSFTFDDPVRTTQHLLDRVYSLIPPAFRPAHIAPLAPPPIIQGCFRNYVHSKLLTIEREGFPIYYGHTQVTFHAVAAQSVLAVFPPTSPLPRTLHKFQALVSRPPNCYIQFKLCACGSVHGYLTSLTDLDAATPLYVGDPPVDHLDFVIQFDGGAFREHRVGGSGIVLWKHTTQGLTLLDTFAVPLFPCPAVRAQTLGLYIPESIRQWLLSGAPRIYDRRDLELPGNRQIALPSILTRYFCSELTIHQFTALLNARNAEDDKELDTAATECRQMKRPKHQPFARLQHPEASSTSTSAPLAPAPLGTTPPPSPLIPDTGRSLIASSSPTSPSLLWFRPVTLRLACFLFDFSPRFPHFLPFCGQPRHTVRLATSRYSMFFLLLLFLLSYPSLLPSSAPLLLPLFPFYPTSSPPRLFPASKGVCPKPLCPMWQHLTNL